jgi:hypothetical protein
MPTALNDVLQALFEVLADQIDNFLLLNRGVWRFVFIELRHVVLADIVR